MVTNTNVLSWEAFEKTPDDAMHRELIRGRLICLPPPRAGQSRMATRLSKALRILEDQGLGSVFIEAGSKLSHDPPTWIQPDVSFHRAEHLRLTDPDGYLEYAPELAVEIISPDDSAEDMERKLDTLLAAGTLVVWVIYPDTRKVRVFLRDGSSYSRGIGEKLTLPELLREWELPVAKLFED